MEDCNITSVSARDYTLEGWASQGNSADSPPATMGIAIDRTAIESLPLAVDLH